MADEEKAPLSQITIIRGTVFDGEIAQPGEVHDVDDRTRHAAGNLIRWGKAVEGAVAANAPAEADKRVSKKDLDTK
jgi:hypothetical protein